MPKLPRIDTEEGHRLYREYVIETAKMWVGYSGIVIGAIGFMGYRLVAAGQPDSRVFSLFAAIFLIGLAVHFTRNATREAAKIRLETKKRFPPPPVESHNSGARPNEMNVGGYNVRFKDEAPRED